MSITRRAMLGTLAAGTVVAPWWEQVTAAPTAAPAADAIGAHVAREMARAYRDMRRLNTPRAHHAETFAANLHLLALHGATLGHDATARRSLRGQAGRVPMMNHDESRRHLEALGVPLDLPMTHPTVEEWDRFVGDITTGRTTVTGVLDTLADHWTARAATWAQQEARNDAPGGGGRIVLAQTNDPQRWALCSSLTFDRAAAQTYQVWACTLVAVPAPEICAAAAVALLAVMWTIWYYGC